MWCSLYSTRIIATLKSGTLVKTPWPPPSIWEPRTSTFSISFIVDTLLTSFLQTTISIDLILTYCIFPHHSLLKWVGKQGVRGSKGRLGGWSEGEPSARRLWCFYVQNVVLVNNADGLSLFQNIWYFIKAPVWTAVPLRLFERHSSLL